MDKNAVKLGLFLMMVGLLSALVLSALNGLTGPVIAANVQKETDQAMLEVYPGADEFVSQENQYVTDQILNVTLAMKGGETAGVIYTVETVGYGGPLTLMAAYDTASRQITGVRILSQSETPGLGANAGQLWFLERYTGKPSDADLLVVKTAPATEYEVEAITAATITTNAVTSGINVASAHFAGNF